jgi:phosphatidylserine/phosphatidylglycerophosphate/cardiolipin synthase-like enzyme
MIGRMKYLILIVLFLTACTANIPVENNLPQEVLFCGRENCTSALAGLLNNAGSAKCALYDVSIPEVQNALKNIDWVTEDGRGALMHNKFCIINQSLVWTGSWNPTRTRDANNAVIVHSVVLADNYLDEFEELKKGGNRRVLHPKIMLNNRLVENYFCPEDDCKGHVIELLDSARQNIRFMLASFTDEDIMRLLQEKHRIMPVAGIIDNAQHDALAELPFAKEGSIHHKVFIIDNKIVITGSYNPTRNGNERNDENILIIHDQLIAKEFLEEFNHLMS